VHRATGTVFGLLVLCLLLPMLARIAQAAVPVLVGILLILALVRLALPPTRRRR
jgi:hypothetical protein